MLKKSRNVIGLIILMAVILTTINFNSNKEMKVNDLNNRENRKMLALMVEETHDKKDFKETEIWPSYVLYDLNEEMTKCVDNNGSVINDAEIIQNVDGSITIRSRQTIYCTLYFNKGKDCYTENRTQTRGDTYTDGQFTYKYEYVGNGLSSNWSNANGSNGWGVILTDKESLDPVDTEMCMTINGKPILWTNNMFNNSKAITIDTNKINTKNIINMTGMFNGSKVTSLDLKNFNTKNVTDMSLMFNKFTGETLDLSNFDTSKVTTMRSMFSSSTNLNTIDLSSFDTSKVSDMSSMFYNCSKLKDINSLKNWNTKNVTNMGACFITVLI